VHHPSKNGGPVGAGSLWLVHKGRPVGVASSLVENQFDIQTLFWTNFEGKKIHSLFFHNVEFDKQSPI
jgi:hypothetical protein